MTEVQKKRWSRVVLALAGVAVGLSALPTDALEWIRFLGGIVLVSIPAYWSNSDKIGDKK